MIFFKKIYSDKSQPFNILDTKNIFTTNLNQNLAIVSSLLTGYYCKKAPKIIVLFVLIFNIYKELALFHNMIGNLYNIFNSSDTSIYFVSNRVFTPFPNDTEFTKKKIDEEKAAFLSMCLHGEIGCKLKGIEEENVGYLKKNMWRDSISRKKIRIKYYF